jgi:hypothetical protein
MNIEQSLYTSLVQLGLDVEQPQEFVISRIPDQHDLTLGYLKKEEGNLPHIWIVPNNSLRRENSSQLLVNLVKVRL